MRNAKVNAQVKQLVQRLGADESPLVAEFYVCHGSGFYVRKAHDFGSLLTDAEKLRTEWATGRVITVSGAQQADRTQSNLNAANEAMRIIEERRGVAV